MIKDIPSREDFEEQGMVLLNIAWDSVMNLLLEYKDVAEWNVEIDAEQTSKYKRASQKPLAIATALLQQGTELLLKAAIAEVSPFLLIVGDARAWPKGCETNDVSFSAFQTCDANQLIRIHDTVSQSRLSPDFANKFTEMRRIRNTVFHSVDRNLQFSEKEILSTILLVTKELYGGGKWMQRRADYLSSIPRAAFLLDGTDYVLVEEFRILSGILSTAQLKEHFGFNRRQRPYICPTCRDSCREAHDEEEPKTAQLRPNTPDSTTIYCVVCRMETPVVRKRCRNGECPGNVINNKKYSDAECLTCGESFDEE